MSDSDLTVGFPGKIGAKGTGIYEDSRLTNELGPYEVQRLRRIKKNEAYLDKLGLGARNGTNTVSMVRATKAVKHKVRRPKDWCKPGEERRSSRLGGSSKGGLVQLSYDETDNFDRSTVAVYDSEEDERTAEERTAEEEERIAQRSARTRVNLATDYELSEEEKKELELHMDKNYLTKFEEFLRYYDKVSDANCRSILRQIEKLSRGEGITYGGWAEGVVFKPGVKITPLSDLIELFAEATEMEARHGRDKGNGWLLKHPIKKLLMFQQFGLNNPEFLKSKSSLKSYVEEGGSGDEEEEEEEEEAGEGEGEGEKSGEGGEEKGAAVKENAAPVAKPPSPVKKAKAAASKKKKPAAASLRSPAKAKAKAKAKVPTRSGSPRKRPASETLSDPWATVEAAQKSLGVASNSSDDPWAAVETAQLSIKKRKHDTKEGPAVEDPWKIVEAAMEEEKVKTPNPADDP